MLKELLAANKISQSELAKQCKVNAGTVSRWVNGKVPVPQYVIQLLNAKAKEQPLVPLPEGVGRRVCVPFGYDEPIPMDEAINWYFGVDLKGNWWDLRKRKMVEPPDRIEISQADYAHYCQLVRELWKANGNRECEKIMNQY